MVRREGDLTRPVSGIAPQPIDDPPVGDRDEPGAERTVRVAFLDIGRTCADGSGGQVSLSAAGVGNCVHRAIYARKEGTVL